MSSPRSNSRMNNNVAFNTFTERLYSVEELNGTNVTDLRAMAGEFSIHGRSKMRKQELVDSILDAQANDPSRNGGMNAINTQRRDTNAFVGNYLRGGNNGSNMNNQGNNGMNVRRNSGNFSNANMGYNAGSGSFGGAMGTNGNAFANRNNGNRNSGNFSNVNGMRNTTLGTVYGDRGNGSMNANRGGNRNSGNFGNVNMGRGTF